MSTFDDPLVSTVISEASSSATHPPSFYKPAAETIQTKSSIRQSDRKVRSDFDEDPLAPLPDYSEKSPLLNGDHNENIGKSRRYRCFPRRRRLCWVLLCIFGFLTVLAAVLIPVGRFVILPGFIKQRISASNLHISELSFDGLHPDFISFSMNLSMPAAVSMGYPFRMTDIVLRLRYAGDDIGSFSMGDIEHNGTSGNHIVIYQQTSLDIENHDKLRVLMTDLIQTNATVSMVFSRYNLQLYNLPIIGSCGIVDQQFSKSFFIDGFHYFQPIRVMSINVLSLRGSQQDEKVDTIVAQAGISFNHQSILSVYLNFFTFRLLFRYRENFYPVAALTVRNLTLSRHASTISSVIVSDTFLKYDGNIDRYSEAFSDFLSAFIHGRESAEFQVDSIGHSDLMRLPNDPPFIPLGWLEDGMRSFRTNVTVNNIPSYGITVSKLSPRSLSIKLVKEMVPAIVGEFEIEAILPHQFQNAPIDQANATFQIYALVGQKWTPILQGESVTGKLSSTTSLLPFDSSVVKRTFVFDVDVLDDKNALKVIDEQGYFNLVKQLITQSSVSVQIVGLADIRLGMFKMPSYIRSMRFDNMMEMNGLSFQNSSLSYLKILGNLDVVSVSHDSSVTFELGDVWMRKQGMGLALHSPLVFSLLYYNASSLLEDVGRVELTSLRLSTCTDSIYDRLLNTTIHTDKPYCPVAPYGTFKATRSTTRKFFSSYLTRGVQFELKASRVPRDLVEARPYLGLSSSLRKYIPSVPKENLVTGIEVKVGMIAAPKLIASITLYNPLSVGLRYYALEFDTFYSKWNIGSLRSNLTQYAAFIPDPNKVNLNETVGDKRNDWGAPSKKCIQSGSCQIAPIDVNPREQTASRALEVSLNISPGTPLLWETLRGKNVTVTITGRALVALGTRKYPHVRNETSGVFDSDDPYVYPPKGNLLVSWLDYEQNTTLRVTF